MKIRNILAAAAVVLLITPSCGSGNSAKSEAEALKNATAADSLLYYLGEMRATEYWRMVQSDTTLKDAKSRAAYIAGLKAGISVMRDGDDAYNQGVYSGLQMAGVLQNLSKNYHQKVNSQKLIDGVKAGLVSDSAVNEFEAQTRLQLVMNRLDAEKQKADQEASAAALKKAAAKEGMTKISENLYGKVEKKGAGSNFKSGDKVTVDMKLTKEDGSDLGLNLPNEITVGETSYLPAVFTEALSQMNAGETEKFCTTAYALFGANAAQMKMEPNDVFILTISAKTAAPAEAPAPEEKK